MKRIQKMSSYLHILLTILLILMPIIEFLKWSGYIPEGVTSDWGLIKTPEGIVDLGKRELPLPSLLTCIVGDIMSFLPLFLGLVVVRSLFGHYKKGEIFSLETIHCFKQIGWLFLLDGLLAKPISEMLMTLGATLSNPEGHRHLILSFGTLNIETMVIGFLTLVISWVMKEGHALQEDQRLTI